MHPNLCAPTSARAAKNPTDAPSLVELLTRDCLDFLRLRQHHCSPRDLRKGNLSTPRPRAPFLQQPQKLHHNTPPPTHIGATHTQWATVIALAAAPVTVAAATRRKTTSATTALSNTIPTLHHNATTTLVRRLAARRIARLDRHPRSMATLGTRTEVASHSEAPLVDRATDPSRTSHSTRRGREHQMALRPTTHRARDPEGSTETMVGRVMLEEDPAHHADAVVVASGPSQHTIAPF